MNLVFNEYCCFSCSSNNCSKHREKTIVEDKKTGLLITVVCICPNHNNFSNLTNDELMIRKNRGINN